MASSDKFELHQRQHLCKLHPYPVVRHAHGPERVIPARTRQSLGKRLANRMQTMRAGQEARQARD